MANIDVYHWKPPPLEWMKFNVVGFVLKDEAGCGEFLRDDKGVTCMVFSRRIKARGAKMAEVIAIKTIMDMDIRSSPKADVPLIIELAQFQITVIHRQSNGMEDALAKAGISRSSFFKALW
ncbi:hypothetical protein GOBAR_DD11616 [Gossypium barbadense]|nr:hypothetical protein GOBAR_DD11616 [Gossypium barbadense]